MRVHSACERKKKEKKKEEKASKKSKQNRVSNEVAMLEKTVLAYISR